MNMTTPLQCTCGALRLEVRGTCIVRAECHCNSCRAAGARLSTLQPKPAFLNDNGGTPYVLFRKDRVLWLQGTQQLREYRLSPDATTRRVVASCCNTPVFLEFESGHWLSLYSSLWPANTRPTPQLRTMTSDLPAPASLPNDIPNSKTQSASFMLKLLGAWIAMGFRVPKLADIEAAPSLPDASPSASD